MALKKVTDEATLQSLLGEAPKGLVKVSDPFAEEPVQAEAEQGFFDPLIGAVEAGATIASGALAAPASGIVGLLNSLIGGTEVGAQSVKDVQQAMTYQPRTAAGQEALQGVAGVLAPVGEAMQSVETTLGDFAYETSGGSPFWGAVGYTAPTALIEAFGLGALKKASKASQAGKVRYQKHLLSDPKLKDMPDAALVKLNAVGEVVDDARAVKAVKNGFTEGNVAAIKNGSLADKAAMRDMFETFKRAKGDDMFALSNKMTDQVGKSVADRLAGIRAKRRQLGTELDKIVKTELRDVDVDATTALRGFADNLKGLDIKIIAKPNQFELKFPDAYNVGPMKRAKSILEDAAGLVGQTVRGKTVNAEKMHKLKKTLDEFIDSAKLGEGGITPQANRILTDLRTSINEAIGAASPRYAETNASLSTAITTMNDFKSLLPKGADWSNPSSARIVGARLKNLDRDAASNVTMADKIANLETAVESLGMKFDTDPRRLLAFKNAVETRFVEIPDGFTAGVAGQAADVAAQTALKNPIGAAHGASRLLPKVFKGSKLKKDMKAEQALRELISD